MVTGHLRGYPRATLSFAHHLFTHDNGNVATLRETATQLYQALLEGRLDAEVWDDRAIRALRKECERRKKDEHAPLQGAIIRLLATEGNWRLAVRELKTARSVKDSPPDERRERALCHNAIAAAAAGTGAWEQVWEQLGILHRDSFFGCLSPATLAFMARHAVANATPAEGLERLSRLVNCLGELRQLPMTSDVEVVMRALREVLEKAGLHGMETKTSVEAATGSCSVCQQPLEAQHLSGAEMEQLREAVFERVMSRQEKWSPHFYDDFKDFRRFMAVDKSFDLVLDGLNAWYWGTRPKNNGRKTKTKSGGRDHDQVGFFDRPPHQRGALIGDSRVKKMQQTMAALRAMGFHRILVIIRRHAWKREVAECLEPGHVVPFFVSNDVEDDPFFLLAALSCTGVNGERPMGAPIITGDLLGKEILQLGPAETGLIQRWLSLNHIHILSPDVSKYSRLDQAIVFPPANSDVAQARLHGSVLRWHLPFAEQPPTFQSRPPNWLCFASQPLPDSALPAGLPAFNERPQRSASIPRGQTSQPRLEGRRRQWREEKAGVLQKLQGIQNSPQRQQRPRQPRPENRPENPPLPPSIKQSSWRDHLKRARQKREPWRDRKPVKLANLRGHSPGVESQSP